MSYKIATDEKAAIIANALRDRGTTQRDTLRAWRQTGGVIAAGSTSTGALSQVATGNLGQEAIASLVPLGMVLIAFVILTDLLACRWDSGPEIDRLAQRALDNSDVGAVRMELVTKLVAQCRKNEKVLERIKINVALELLVGIGGVLVLLTQLT